MRFDAARTWSLAGLSGSNLEPGRLQNRISVIRPLDDVATGDDERRVVAVASSGALAPVVVCFPCSWAKHGAAVLFRVVLVAPLSTKPQARSAGVLIIPPVGQ